MTQGTLAYTYTILEQYYVLLRSKHAFKKCYHMIISISVHLHLVNIWHKRIVNFGQNLVG